MSNEQLPKEEIEFLTNVGDLDRAAVLLEKWWDNAGESEKEGMLRKLEYAVKDYIEKYINALKTEIIITQDTINPKESQDENQEYWGRIQIIKDNQIRIQKAKKTKDIVNGLYSSQKNYFKFAGVAVLLNYAVLFTGGINALAMSVGADISHLKIVSAYLGYEAMPGLGGLQALLCTGLAVFAYGIPQTLNIINEEAIDNTSKRNDLKDVWLRTLSSMSEIGFLTMPLAINSNLSHEDLKLYINTMIGAVRTIGITPLLKSIIDSKLFTNNQNNLSN